MADETRSIRLDSSERYPFFQEVIGPRSGYAVEVPIETAERWKRVMVELGQVQDEMEAAYDAARNRDVLAAAEARADQLVEEAHARRAKAQHARANPPWLIDSWNAPGADSCRGWKYGTRDEAKADRMALHNNFPDVTFDLEPYVCADGHHHLRRRA